MVSTGVGDHLGIPRAAFFFYFSHFFSFYFFFFFDIVRITNLTGSAFSASELSSNILSLLKSNKSGLYFFQYSILNSTPKEIIETNSISSLPIDLVLSNDLLEMLGFESFDFVELLMKNRVKILGAHTGQVTNKQKQTNSNFVLTYHSASHEIQPNLRDPSDHPNRRRQIC